MAAALVTGATGGIGSAIVRDLLASGWGVTAMDLGDPPYGFDGAFELTADVSEKDACVAAVAAHDERFGELQLLVNCAGIFIEANLERQATIDWDRAFSVNTRGLFLITREALPLLRKQRGLIVNLASMAGLRGAGESPTYAATKHAVVGFTRSINAEFSGEGIRATALCPSYVATPMARRPGSPPDDEMITPEDIARTVRYLLELSPVCVVPELPILRAGSL